MTKEENYTPTEEEIDSALAEYHHWLEHASSEGASRDRAIATAEKAVKTSRTFSGTWNWIVENDYALIYTVDEQVD